MIIISFDPQQIYCSKGSFARRSSLIIFLINSTICRSAIFLISDQSPKFKEKILFNIYKASQMPFRATRLNSGVV